MAGTVDSVYGKLVTGCFNLHLMTFQASPEMTPVDSRTTCALPFEAAVSADLTASRAAAEPSKVAPRFIRVK